MKRRHANNPVQHVLSSTPADFHAFYPDATKPLKSELHLFRLKHTPRTASVDGITWTYFTGGRGSETVLVLHGGGGPAESLFRYIQAFEHGHRVIAPTVPVGVTTVAAALGGILALLDREGIHDVHVFGMSNGGMIGQVLVRQHPERVRSLTLSHTMLPSEAYARAFARRARAMQVMPLWLIRAVGLWWLKRQLNADRAISTPAEKAFWSMYFTELYRSELLSKAYFVSRAKLLADYFGNCRFLDGDLSSWPGEIRIIESGNDAVVNAGERDRLKRFYPHAKVLTFPNAGHVGGGLFTTEPSVRFALEAIARTMTSQKGD